MEVWGFQRYYYLIEFCWESVCGDIDERKCIVEEGYRFKVWTNLGELIVWFCGSIKKIGWGDLTFLLDMMLVIA